MFAYFYWIFLFENITSPFLFTLRDTLDKPYCARRRAFINHYFRTTVWSNTFRKTFCMEVFDIIIFYSFMWFVWIWLHREFRSHHNREKHLNLSKLKVLLYRKKKLKWINGLPSNGRMIYLVNKQHTKLKKKIHKHIIRPWRNTKKTDGS